MMMISPNAALLRILDAERYTSSSICACVSLAPRYLSLLMPMWWHTASTMMTAPSTISPKSIAPRLIRFPLTPKSFIMPNANSMDSGITEATTSPAR